MLYLSENRWGKSGARISGFGARISGFGARISGFGARIWASGANFVSIQVASMLISPSVFQERLF